MANSLQKNTWTQRVLNIVLILLFFALALLFPYTGDDWAWGSQIGLNRLAKWFAGYNGRYAGNLLVLLLTRSKLLDAACMALCFWASCQLCLVHSREHKAILLPFSVLLFFLMPTGLFRQAVVWTAGFCNYVPSGLCALLYVVTIQSVFLGVYPTCPRCFPPLFLLVGFLGGLFVENMTLFQLAIGILVIVYSVLRLKRVHPVCVAFLLGTVAACICMFSNSVYSSIASGDDSYRTMASSLSSLISLAATQLLGICDNLFLSNVLMCCVLSGLSLILSLLTSKVPPRWTLSLNILSLAVMGLRALLVFLSHRGRMLTLLSNPFLSIGISLVYAVSLLIIGVFSAEKQRRLWMVLPGLCIPVMAAPLLVVTPIGPRCFYGCYLMMMLYACRMLDEILIALSSRKTVRLKNPLRLCLNALCVICFAVSFCIFVPIHQLDTARTQFARAQAESGETTIVFTAFPDTTYLWCAEPENAPWDERYKLFYQLPENISFHYVDQDSFDTSYAEFKQRSVSH